MGLYNFKDNYPPALEGTNEIAWFSAISSTPYNSNYWNTFTRTNPAKSQGNIGLGSVNRCHVFSGGVHTGSLTSGGNTSVHMIGQGMGNTVWKKNISISAEGNQRASGYLYDMDIADGLSIYVRNEAAFYRCRVYGNYGYPKYNCKLYVQTQSTGSNSFIGAVGATVQNVNLDLFDTCDVAITSQGDVNRSTYNYLAFNNCRFKIGTETDYVALTGSTESALRQNFVDRCTNAGYTVPTITEYGDVNLPAGRWVFSNNSAVDGLVLKGSTIYAFEQSRLIYFGYTSVRGDSIAITTDTTKPGAFNPNGANADLDVTNGSIAFKSNVNISQPNTGMSDTNIIWLGGKKQLNLLSLIHNFPMQYGVMVDDTPTLSVLPVAIDDIVPYENGQSRTYLVRSTDDNAAQVVYNGVTYSSAISNYNNVFRGVSGQTSFTPSPNAAVYEILDEVMHQTVQMRIVNKIPADIITTGDLQAGYWYLVEPNSPTDTTGTVTYNGVTYPAYSSFLVASGTLGFTVNGATHLRRCWRQYYDDPANETTDLAFWANEQKPKWFDVLPDDLRCLMKHNNGLENEMQTDAEGNYITSGHPDFYNSILGVSGIFEPAYPVKGTYMQLRLVITTLNPM